MKMGYMEHAIEEAKREFIEYRSMVTDCAENMIAGGSYVGLIQHLNKLSELEGRYKELVRVYSVMKDL